MRWWLLPVVTLSLACATLRTSTGTLNWPVLLADAQFSITEACSVEWLPPPVCTLTTDALTTTSAALARSGTLTPAIAQTLRDVFDVLPVDSRARPYLRWVIDLLPAVPSGTPAARGTTGASADRSRYV
jgi:hypothetical protein